MNTYLLIIGLQLAIGLTLVACIGKLAERWEQKYRNSKNK
jgi:uncharacterized membrane protein